MEDNAAGNRRAFMRHDDDVLLKLRRLDPKTFDGIVARLGDWRRGYRLATGPGGEHAALGAALRRIRLRDPDLAVCLARLERRLDALACHVMDDADDEVAAALRPVRVNLSAQGLRCHTREALEEGDAVEIGMELLPDGEQVAVIGRVLRADRDGDGPIRAVSVRFEHVPARDEETLVRHVFRLERESHSLGRRAA